MKPTVSLAAIAMCASVALALPGSRQEPSAWCRSFKQYTNYTRRAETSDSYRISVGAVCLKNATTGRSCSVTGGGYLLQETVYKKVNATGEGADGDDDDDDGTDETNSNGDPLFYNSAAIDWTIYNVTGDYNPYYGHSDFGAVANMTQSFSADTFNDGNTGGGTGVYVLFTPTLRCVRGAFSDCPASLPIDNGTVIETCYPLYTDKKVNGVSEFNGTSSLYVTTPAAVANLTTNPYAKIPPGLQTGVGSMVHISRSTAGLGVIWVLIVWAFLL